MRTTTSVGYRILYDRLTNTDLQADTLTRTAQTRKENQK